MIMGFHRNARGLLALGCLLVCFGCMERPEGLGLGAPAPDLSRFVRVTGMGSFHLDPNRALVDLVVLNEGATAKVAYAVGQQRLTALKLALEQVGLKRQEISARRYTLDETWAEVPDGVNAGNLRKSYRMRHEVRVSVRDLVKLPEVLETAAAHGADSIRNVIFDFSNAQTLNKRAREGALADALAKATLLAEESQQHLGAVLNIVEQPAGAGGNAWLDGDVEASSFTVSVTLDVTYALSDF